ncbi:MAG: tetratricopeptide repeat protein [Enterobacterales bacterium]|nr:tetratricopeptide repeat protein [Enterobacterales bacterium]
MDQTPEVVKRAPLIVFNGKDPMSKVKINSEIRELYSQIGGLIKLKKYKKSITLLNTVKTRYPQLSGPDYQLARVYYRQGDLEKALVAVDASIAKNQRNYYSVNFRGVVLRSQGKFKQAKESYLKAIAIYPPYPNAHLNLGVLADIYLGELKLALVQYQSYMELIGNKDKDVANWVIEIERRIKAGG